MSKGALALMATASVLGGVLIVELTGGEGAGGPAVSGPAGETGPPPGPAFAMPPRGSVTDFVERPLFEQGRRYAEPAEISLTPAPTPAPPPGPPSLERYKLTAVAISQETRFAIVVDTGSGRTVGIAVDDDLDGWRVESIESREVLLRHGEDTARLVLRENDERGSGKKEQARVKKELGEGETE